MDVFQPQALYPPLLTKPLNLVNESRYETLIEIKKQLRTGLNDRASCLIDDQASKDKLDFQATIQRYSDKYSKKSKLVEGNKWQPDWTRLPRELKFFQQGEVSKEKKQPTKRKVPASGKKEKSGKVKKEAMDYIDLDTLARIITADDEPENEEGGEGAGANEEGAAAKSRDKDKAKGSDDEGEKDQEDDELEGDDEEENIEEENDYIDTYFDNGEDYNDDEGGGDDDGPVY